MADKSILEIIKDENAKALRESVKASVKKLFADRIKAVEVLKGIDEQIIAEVSKIGENPEDVKAVLG